MAVTFPLEVPVEAGGRQLTELVLQDPRGVDLQKAGMPYDLAVDGGKAVLRMNTENAVALASRLANVPPSTIGKLSGRDFSRLMGELVGFLEGQTPARSSAPTSE